MPNLDTSRTITLTWRDFYLIPATIVLTLVALTMVLELGARVVWTEQPKDSCEVWENGALVRVLPNCHTRVKNGEGDWVEYQYNECGYRSAASCTGKPANAKRIVVMGTSVSRGYWIRYDDSFTGRLEKRLTSQCHQPVEFQNLSVGVAQGPTWHKIADQRAQALALKPDAIVVVVTNYDLMAYHAPTAGSLSAGTQGSGIKERLDEIKNFVAGHSQGMSLAKHFALADPNRYVQFFLGHGDSADFLRSPLTQDWIYRLGIVDKAIASIAESARKKDVPVFLLLAPSRPTVLAAHIAAEIPLPGVNLNIFPDALSAIASHHSVKFVNPTAAESRATDWNDLFFYADGHPTARGHSFLADELGEALVHGAAGFSQCTPPQTQPVGDPSKRSVG